MKTPDAWLIDDLNRSKAQEDRYEQLRLPLFYDDEQPQSPDVPLSSSTIFIEL